MAQTTISINTSLGFAGGLYDLSPIETMSGVNSDVVTIPGGVMLSLQIASSVVVPNSFVLPTAAFTAAGGSSAGLPAGISVFTQALDTIGLQTETAGAHVNPYNLPLFKVGREMAVLRKGKIIVAPEVTVDAGDPVYARYVVNTGTNQGQLGTFSNATDDSKNSLVQGARFETASDSVTGLAALSFDINAMLSGIAG